MAAINIVNPPGLSRNRYLDPQAIVDGVDKYISAHEGNFKLKSTANYLRLVVKNIEQAVHAKENGNFYAAHSTQFPIEFFWPLGIMPLSNELYSTIVGIIGDDDRQFLQTSDDVGFACCNCSCCSTFCGMAEVGAWPVPDFVVYSSSPCDPTPKGKEVAAKCTGVPSFGLDRPYRIFTPQSMNYYLTEHQALVRFLEEQTGRKMDYEYLKEVAQLSYRATQVYMEVNELRRAVPCPMPAEAAFAPMAVYRAWAGTQTCIDFLEQLRDELKERVTNGIGAVPREKFRYTYAASPPFFDFRIMAEMERRYGAVNVMDHLQWWREGADWLIDPDDPVASIAYRVQFGTSNSLHGTATDHAKEVRRAALKCRADGVVYFNNLGCRHAAGGYRVFKNALARSLGLPWVTINCNMLDKSFTSFDQVMDQLDVFWETVEHSEAYQERTRQRGQQAQLRGQGSVQ